MSCPSWASLTTLRSSSQALVYVAPTSHGCSSIPIPRRIVLRTNDQTPPLLRPFINRLNNINQLLLILQHPVQLIIISRPEIAHHVLVPEEEHQRHSIVELVHLLEVRHLVDIADVDDGEVLYAVGDFVEDFVLPHAVRIPVATEADYDETVFFGHDGLVDVPAGYQVGDYDGAHSCWKAEGVDWVEVRFCLLYDCDESVFDVDYCLFEDR